MAVIYNSSKIVTDGLVLCLDAANPRSYLGAGTEWTDIISGGNGTLTNGPTFNHENGGNIVFDGSDDYCDTEISPISLVPDGGDVTISVWVFPHVTSQGMILGNGNSNRFYVETFSGKFHWGFGGSQNSATSQALFSVNNWYNYVATYDGSNANGYLNGVLTEATSISTPTYGDSAIKLGTWQSNLYFNGNIANATIYNKALTEQEIKQNYNATKGRFQ